MAAHSSNNSVSSLDDTYDMVDDVSELSSDDHETVSIASTNDHEDQGEEPDYDNEDHTLVPTQDTNTANADEARALAKDQAFKVRLPFHQGMEVSCAPSEPLLDNTIDDLATSKQSIITAKPFSPASSIWDDIPPKQDKSKFDTVLESWGLQSVGILYGRAFLWLLFLSLLFASFGPWAPGSLQPLNTAQRTPQLNAALQQLTGSDTFMKQVNYTHLLPDANIASTFWGSPVLSTGDVHYQAILPNYLVVSLPQVAAATFPEPVSFSVKRGTKEVSARHTQLIRGVHAITIPVDDAYGVISVSMACKNPDLAVAIAQDFGSRLLNLKTYEKACTDISKAFAKDVIVAQKAAKAVSHDFESYMRTASSRLQSKSRELAALHDKAAQTLRDAENVGRNLAGEVGKDLQTIFDGARDTIKSWVPTSAVIKNPILLSRERAVTITDRVLGLSKSSYASRFTGHKGPTKRKDIYALLRGRRDRQPTCKKEARLAQG